MNPARSSGYVFQLYLSRSHVGARGSQELRDFILESKSYLVTDLVLFANTVCLVSLCLT